MTPFGRWLRPEYFLENSSGGYIFMRQSVQVMNLNQSRMFVSSSVSISRRLLSCAACGFIAMTSLAQLHDHEDRLAPEPENLQALLTPDVSEGYVPPAPKSGLVTSSLFSSFGPSSQQPQGALSGKIVFMNSGHGWTWFGSSWNLQRGIGNEMNEDYGNLDQLNFFAQYCFNAGATVVSFRPLGHQTNEVVLDNDDAAVTFAGAWSFSSNAVFFGSPGDVPYRFASFNPTETATATYTPTIPAAGYYPVYAWTLSGSDRGDQLYRIRHTGGESLIRLPHHMVGNGWIYLGEYYFNAGSNSASGAVVISNLRGSATGTTVIADAIRFGNGMGTVNFGGGVSDYPREEESMRYWIQHNIGQGQTNTLYDGTGDDESDSWSAPPKMSAEMNRQAAGDIYDRVHISFHSNAGGGRGTVGLITGDPTPNQADLADITGGEVNDDLVALGSPPLEVPWFNKVTHTFSGGYSEIDGSLFNYEMPATIIEVAFHDSAPDAQLLRDPKARAAVGKAAMHGVIKFMNAFDTNNPAPLLFLPEPPTNVRAISSGTNGNITVSWTAPVSTGGSQSPTNYVLYRSTNGFGFGNAISVGNVTSVTVSNLTANVDYYFRIAAANGGGESMASEVVACRAPSTNGAAKVLFVNAYDRFERTQNLRMDLPVENYNPPDASGSIERVFGAWNNSFDYVVAHGKALAAAGAIFDSCQNEAVSAGTVALSNYSIVIWACGNESVADETFSATEQTRISTFLAAGGALFASGAEIAWDLDRASGPTAGDRVFLNSQLHADLGADANDNAASYTVTPAGGGLFVGKSNGVFDDGSKGIYAVRTPDKLTPNGPGAAAALNYVGGLGGASAVQYDGSAGGGRVLLMGFPFETITSLTVRTQYMGAALTFLSLPIVTNAPPSIAPQPVAQSVIQGSNATLAISAFGTAPLAYQWRFNGATIPGATNFLFTRTNCLPAVSGDYVCVVTNAFGAVTSQIALLEVSLIVTQPLFTDNFDAHTAVNWTTNRSSTDTRITFNWDYSLIGISSAPNSAGGTTRGLRLEANLLNTNVAAVSVSPIGQSFGGNFRLRFDMWINANGPFPAGGNGSTEHLTAGVGTTGNNVQWNTGSADGVWFATDGEGQATDTSATTPDWRAYVGIILQQTNSGVWLGGNEPNVRGNGHPYYASTFPGGQTAPAFQQSNFAQQTGALAVGTVGFAWRDVIISKTGNTVEWFIDGLKIAAVTNASLTASNIFLGYWDSFTSLSDNTNLSFGLVDNVRVERFITNVPPYLTAQPQSVTVPVGSNATFNVTAGGTATLAYQWRLNGANIAGATSSSYTRLNAQVAHAGNYSVVVTNTSGSVTSSVAALTLTPTAPLLFTSIARLPDGRVQLGMSGEAGFNVQLRTSTNLTTWSVLTNLVNPSGSLSFTDAPPASVPNQFYRALYP